MKFVTNYKELEDGDKTRSLLDHCKAEPIKNKKLVLDYMGDQKYLDTVIDVSVHMSQDLAHRG